MDRGETTGTPAREDYTGHELDTQTQLHYAGARYYMTAFGRWTSREPLLNGDPRRLMKDNKRVLLSMSPYNYSLNNPTNLRDPDGRCPICWDIADIGFAVQSVAKAWSDPSWSNIGWATADVAAAALPIVSSTGYGRGGVKLLSGADEVAGLLPRFSKSSISEAQGLIGKEFEDFLQKNLGGSGSFTKGGRQFDVAAGDRWIEAKSGGFWDLVTNDSKKMHQFKSKMGERLKIATENNKSFELISNTPIPDGVKNWLGKKGIEFTEMVKR
jgi:RHS repeat-associated protein